ncbi:MAG: hypothetical protein F6K21_36630 [Symploca sp. SIO2D2]|nr:hypothetical protein [Symploca sp. SIO2D2]
MPLETLQPGKVRAHLNSLLEDKPITEASLRSPHIEEANSLLKASGGNLGVAPHSSTTLLWDLENYYSGYYELLISGGRDATVRIIWAEGLYENLTFRDNQKNDRREIVGKFLPEGLGDRFVPDGSEDRRFTPIWWRAGRYCLIQIETAQHSLELKKLSLHASGHPFDWQGTFSSDQDDRLAPILKASKRTLEVSSWDTYQDCPYYEQLMYVGDTCIELLITYAQAKDSALPQRVIELYESSREQWNGLVASRFPSQTPQFISTFSMIWVWIARDYLYWQDDPEFAAQLLPGLRHSMERFAAWEDEDGLIENVPGWPFVDWVDEWEEGVPNKGRDGVSSVLNLIYLLTLQAASAIELAIGEPELAALFERRSQNVSHLLRTRYWNKERSLIQDDESAKAYSIHAQILGTLTGVIDDQEACDAFQAASSSSDVSVASYMFRHYHFEALRKIGKGSQILTELEAWQGMIDLGADTVWERLEPTRSDCHAWSSHPLFHLPCSVAGVRPSAPFFKEIEIAPQPGPLTFIKTTVPHPQGLISLDLRFENGNCQGSVELPAETSGKFSYAGQEVNLVAGYQKL